MKVAVMDQKFIRVKLVLWFLVLAIWTIFSPKIGKRVLIAFVTSEENERVRKAFDIH